MIPKWKILLSYAYPIQILRTKTPFQTLEINLVDGQLMLDSEFANYSFGSLHKVFQEVLPQIAPIPPNGQCLVIGFGAGSAAAILRNQLNFQGPITGIEIDERVIELGKNYFNFGQWRDTEILVGDAWQILPQLQKNYDCIITDIFIDTYVPEKFQEISFFELMVNRLKPKGQMVMNTMLNKNNQLIKQRWNDYLHGLGTCNSYKVQGENEVLSFQKN